jgi:hypothetical protein
MPVRDQNRAEIPPLLPNVANVRDDQIDPALPLLGELATGVEQDEIIAILDRGHILADLADPAERDDAQPPERSAGRGWLLRRFGPLPSRCGSFSRLVGRRGSSGRLPRRARIPAPVAPRRFCVLGGARLFGLVLLLIACHGMLPDRLCSSPVAYEQQ